MGNQTGTPNGPAPQGRPQQPRSEYGKGQDNTRMNIETAVNTLQSMFIQCDRTVLRMILVDQCAGNMDQAVETLLAMTTSQNINNVSRGGGTTVAIPQNNKPKKNQKPVFYDSQMRPITVSEDFLQPPSYYLQKYYGIDRNTISRMYENSNELKRKVNIDPSIVGRWTNLMGRYKWKSGMEMQRVCNLDCTDLRKCHSLVRVIFMMSIYQNLCNNPSGQDNGDVMHDYLKAFKEYSLIQLINDCNHLTQFHNFSNKLQETVEQRAEFVTIMTSYFGHCDVMNCKVIQRILVRQDIKMQVKNEKNNRRLIDDERDVIDKYHRMFLHPVN